MTHTIAIPGAVKKSVLYVGHSLEDPEIQTKNTLIWKTKYIAEKKSKVKKKITYNKQLWIKYAVTQKVPNHCVFQQKETHQSGKHI